MALRWYGESWWLCIGRVWGLGFARRSEEKAEEDRDDPMESVLTRVCPHRRNEIVAGDHPKAFREVYAGEWPFCHAVIACDSSSYPLPSNQFLHFDMSH